MLLRPTAVLTEEQVIIILEMLKNKIPHHVIAKEFKVSSKTISRISTGETWKEMSSKYKLQIPSQAIMPLTEYYNLHDEVVAVKNHFGLCFNQPLYWGWFEAWDGLHSVVSDGYIIWESTDLVKFAIKLSNTGIKGHPVWADLAEELPTFELEDIMTQSVGNKLHFIDAGVPQKYVNIANKMKLEIREGGKETIYLTKRKIRSKSNPTNIVIACIMKQEA